MRDRIILKVVLPPRIFKRVKITFDEWKFTILRMISRDYGPIDYGHSLSMMLINSSTVFMKMDGTCMMSTYSTTERCL